MGTVIPLPVETIDHDALQRSAETAAVRGLVTMLKTLNVHGLADTLSEQELKKLVCAVISEWIKERSKQAAALGSATSLVLAFQDCDAEPWELGAVETALPALADLAMQRGIIGKPLGEWAREDALDLFWSAWRAIDEARRRRDRGEAPF